MRFFSSDPDVPGVIAVGQYATGIFALGQVAVGVVAIGQIARGVFAVGQVAVGVVAIGQAALGVVYGGGMISAAGRGFGICLKVLPKMSLFHFERPELPKLTSLKALRSGASEAGWLLARIVGGRLRVGRVFPDLEWSEDATRKLVRGVDADHNHACVRVEARSEAVEAPDSGYRQAVERRLVLSVARLQTWAERSPRVEISGPLIDPIGLTLRGLGFVCLVIAWGGLVGRDLLELLLGI